MEDLFGELDTTGVAAAIRVGTVAAREVVDHARGLVAAAAEAKARGQGAFAFEGKMVDEPVVRRAQALLRRASNSR